jgi:hypothetical protein
MMEILTIEDRERVMVYTLQLIERNQQAMNIVDSGVKI